MNEKILNGLKRVQRRLFGFCWIWIIIFVFNAITNMIDNVKFPISALLSGIFFIISFILHGIVKSFICGVENREE